jgi:O-antigen ligase
VLAPSARLRALSLAGALALAPVVLLGDVWDTTQVRELRDHPAVAVILVALGAGLVAAGAAVLLRRPEILPVAAIAVLPFRIPLSIGGETANLLVPLYLVIAAGAVAWIVRRLREPDGERPVAPGRLEWFLFGFVVLYAAQAAYSSDLSQATQHVAFFYIPFGVLFLLLVEVRWTPRLLTTSLWILAGLALLFCAVAFVEYAVHDVLLNDKLKESNLYNPYFRVNSLFFDPNIFGRFLVVVMILVTPIAAWSQRRADVRRAIALLVILFAGLLTTLSQSSFGALLVGVAVLCALRWSGRRVAVAAGVVVVAGAVLVVAFPGALGLNLDKAGSVSKATSGRSDLIEGGADLFAKRPLQGFGSGSFPKEYREETNRTASVDVAASHTIPLTVAVEQGVIGLIAYVGLLFAAFSVLVRRARDGLLRAAIAAAFAAVVFHTFGYAAFLEDPLTWALLAVGVALAQVGRARGGVEPATAVAAYRSSSATSVSPTSRKSL